MEDKTLFFRGILAWVSATLFVVFAFTMTTSFGMYAANVQASLKIISGQYNLVSGIYTIVFGLMQIPAGYLIQNKNAKLITTIAVACFLFGVFLFSVTTNYPMFILSNIVMSLGASFSFIAAVTLIGQWFDGKLFPVFVGLTQASSLILASLLHMLFVYFLKMHSWQNILRFADILGIGILVLVILFVANPPKSAHMPDTNIEPVSLGESFKAVIKSKTAWVVALAAAFSFGSMMGYVSFWGIISKQTQNVTHFNAVMITGWGLWGVGIGTPFFGWLSNKLNQRLKLTIQMTCFAILFCLLSIYLPQYTIETNVPAGILMFLIGFFGSASMLFYTMAKELTPAKYEGAVLGFVNMLVFVFQSTVFMIPYVILMGASTSAYFNFLWIIPFFMVISVMLALKLKDPLTNKEAMG